MSVFAPRLRAVVDNDFAGDPDGLVALAHLALADAVGIALVTVTAVDPALAAVAGVDGTRSAQAGRERAAELFRVAGIPAPEIVAGREDFDSSGSNPAAEAIARVGATAGLPLVILCGGPLTNVAAALRTDPALAERATLVWIGGTASGEGSEYNLDTDVDAAVAVRASGIPMSRVPREQYARLRVSVAEVRDDLSGTGVLGRWISARLLDIPAFVRLHGTLTLGDSGLAAVAALEPERLPDDARPQVTVDGIDTRLLWADFLALLRTHERHTKGTP